ncbi:GTP-binding protein [Formosa sediminum]|uniref:GTP-binding protein n=1 Tax=Formosa sediminum TaxID=2594004 RepID=A0A516GTP2_9FLAO|nr:GTP-binding protein [Formosa sediminum]QDO94891.1 GTP-binding protein [Formosa sediminum]
MEAIITIVGFLGAGKTTLLKHLVHNAISYNWHPFVVLNDYENANLDAVQFTTLLEPKYLRALTGSCICCSGIDELRQYVNRIPERPKGITLIEANGTTDACTLMEFLGVGLNDRFLPPIQISVVNVTDWQTRGAHNDLEKNQVQVSSLIVLTHLEHTTTQRQKQVILDLETLNPFAKITTIDGIDINELPELNPSKYKTKRLDHRKAHWSSCSVDLPVLVEVNQIYRICNKLPKGILRVKGCTQIEGEEQYTYFERTPDGKVFTRPFNGIPITGAKLLTIGPGSVPYILTEAIQIALQNRS